ncbi:MAG: ATP-binding cassette domain-containing protein, partial [Chlamydiae bacterium]|nr:ATP-binding cassette domain-containing protein [Chlamydiota bacterium]
IGVAGYNLSGGQRQRIGLARAFYDNPKLVILDEPNANLDEAGEIALSNSLIEAKKRGVSVIVISHRPSVLSVVDKILILQDGLVAAFGNKKEIMEKIMPQNNAAKNDGTIHLNQMNKS